MKTHIEHAPWHGDSFWYNTIYQVIETGQIVYVLDFTQGKDFYTQMNTIPFYLTVEDRLLCITLHLTQRSIHCHSNVHSPTITLVSIYTLKFTT